MQDKNEVELPLHIINQMMKVYLEIEKLQQSLKREPSNEEIAQSLGWLDSKLHKNAIKRVEKIKSLADDLKNLLGYEGNVLDLLNNEQLTGNN
jgi:DNA-directed RNA polymerase sigma subunit (sigma70/sigma32)